MAVNAALVVGSVTMTLLICEFVVFRYVLVASDVPTNQFVDNVVRYAPYQTGVWRVLDDIAAPYAINGQGWNSGVGDYVVARKPGVGRVAIIGDSMVEAMQVPYDRSVGERLAAELARNGSATEVYRFGISGAPLSQYLYMVEREVSRYAPDWIVVVLIHNDFDESLKPVKGRYTSSFLKVRVENGRVVEEVPPSSWTPGPVEWIRRTATMRYLYYRKRFPIDQWREWIVPAARADADRFAANVRIDAVRRQMPDIAAATDHLFGRLKQASQRIGARLLLVMDGDRQSIYAGIAEPPALALNLMSAELARRHDIPFVDLHPVFAASWQATGRRFEYPSDNHWNEDGHALAARAIARAITGHD